jgi:cytochrome c oxidase subunit 3
LIRVHPRPVIKEFELTALDHGYIAEEHAPDPVIGHGDPAMPGKIGIWLFLASEIMFFVGILGTYIIYRSGAPALFEKHGETLSKPLAALNTVVLIFSSLTMALAVDAAQKGDQKRVRLGLLVTLLCAATFMGVKMIEYRDKWFHHTIVATADAKVEVKAPAGQKLYAAVSSSSTGSVYSPLSNNFEPSSGMSSAKRRERYAIALTEVANQPGTYTATIPAAAAGPNTLKVYARTGDTPSPKDKPVTDATNDYAGGVFVFDGHVHNADEGKAYEFHGWRAPYPKDTGVDVHLISEKEIRELPGATKIEKDGKVDKARINSDVNYGPWKNNFFASYFTLTGVHGIHVMAGMIPLTILLVQSLRGRLFPQHTEYVGLYWHFVDLVWIFLFPLLYLI